MNSPATSGRGISDTLFTELVEVLFEQRLSTGSSNTMKRTPQSDEV